MSSLTSSVPEKALNQFNEKRVSQRTPQVSLNGSLPLSDLRDEQQTSGTAGANFVGIIEENF